MSAGKPSGNAQGTGGLVDQAPPRPRDEPRLSTALGGLCPAGAGGDAPVVDGPARGRAAGGEILGPERPPGTPPPARRVHRPVEASTAGPSVRGARARRGADVLELERPARPPAATIDRLPRPGLRPHASTCRPRWRRGRAPGAGTPGSFSCSPGRVAAGGGGCTTVGGRGRAWDPRGRSAATGTVVVMAVSESARNEWRETFTEVLAPLSDSVTAHRRGSSRVG